MNRDSKLTIHHFLNIVFELPKAKVVIVLQILSSFSSFIGIPLLVPILELLRDENGVHHFENNFLFKYIAPVFKFLNIDLTFNSLLFVVTFLIILSQSIQFLANIASAFSQIKLNEIFRIKLLTAYQESKWSWLNSSRSGEINFSIIKESDMATHCNLYALRILLNTIQLLSLLILSYTLSWKSTFLASIVFGFIWIFSKWNAKKIHSHSTEYHFNFSILTNLLSSIQTNKKFLKTNNKDGIYFSGLSRLIERLSFIDYRQNGRQQAQSFISTLIGFLFLVSLMILHKQLNLSYAKLTVILFVFFRLAPLFNALTDCISTFMSNFPYYSSYKTRVHDLASNREIMGEQSYNFEQPIQFKNVSFSQSSKLVFDQINFTVKPNMVYGISGKSGIGKTTLIDLIMGLWRPNSGHIYYGSTEHEKVDYSLLRSKVAYVGQEVTLFHGSLRHNITLGNKDFEKNVEKAVKLSGLEDVVKNLPNGLDENIGENGSKLSGGQRQRVSFARALIQSPQMLILDEATSALDQETEQAFMHTIQEIKKEMTIMIISHKISSFRYVDQILFIQSENSIISGTIDELKEKSAAFRNLLQAND